MKSPNASRLSPRLEASPFAIAACVAVFGMIAAYFMTWFRVVDHVDVPPFGPADLSWSGWHSGRVDNAALLTLVGPLMALVGVGARLVARSRWVTVAALVGFAASLAGSIQSFGEVGSDWSAPGFTITAEAGVWLFSAAAVLGVAVSTIDLVARRPAPSIDPGGQRA